MTVAEYIVDELIGHGVTDAFGIPGGVILKLLYAMEDRKAELEPHLGYHEQMAGFAACGYAQASGKLGVAYATRGPGIANMVTCMAEAYQESLPVLFLTAHGQRTESQKRFEDNQELDIVRAVSGFVKYASNIETLNEVSAELKKACNSALQGRKGPVVLDFASKLFGQEMSEYNGIANIADKVSGADKVHGTCVEGLKKDGAREAVEKVIQRLHQAHRPVILIGDGIRGCADDRCIKILERLGYPVLSSRASQDIAGQSELYYGYIGSHGLRYSNFILSKADLIIVLGNRLAFPVNSKSYMPVMEKAEVIRFDADEKELENTAVNSLNFVMDAAEFINELNSRGHSFEKREEWMATCNILKKQFDSHDISEPAEKLTDILEKLQREYVYVCDVGNNEFWFARAYEKVRPKGRVLYSKAFGTLGVALGRAIGAYFATRKDIVCIIGDQGFQYNIQELQFISCWELPIGIILLNNEASGMISDHEKKIFGDRLVHVTEKTGYSIPDFAKVVHGYGIEYLSGMDEIIRKIKEIDGDGIRKPFVCEISFDKGIELIPNLPKGNACQDMEPLLEREVYNWLDAL